MVFHAWLRKKPSSLLWFPGWSSIPIPSLKIQSTCLVFFGQCSGKKIELCTGQDETDGLDLKGRDRSIYDILNRIEVAHDSFEKQTFVHTIKIPGFIMLGIFFLSK
jgi:hypothetical protein